MTRILRGDRQTLARGLALMQQYQHLVDDPDALIAEIKRQGLKDHVRADEDLSFLLGVLIGAFERALERRFPPRSEPS